MLTPQELKVRMQALTTLARLRIFDTMDDGRKMVPGAARRMHCKSRRSLARRSIHDSLHEAMVVAGRLIEKENLYRLGIALPAAPIGACRKHRRAVEEKS